MTRVKFIPVYLIQSYRMLSVPQDVGHISSFPVSCLKTQDHHCYIQSLPAEWIFDFS